MANHETEIGSDSGHPEEARSTRLLSLDAFRGVTILAMILVNNPGSWREMYWPLRHAEWHGWTPTDLIFPFFLFIVGTAMAYSLRKYVVGGVINAPGAPGDSPGAKWDRTIYWRIVRRTALLIFLGWFPSLLFRTIDYASGTAATLDLENLRLPGVLVRIGLVYFFASMIVLHVPVRGQAAIGVVILVAYWCAFAFLPPGQTYAQNLSREGNVAGAIDRAVLGTNHMWSGDRLTDPEGILSTLPAVVTALFGYWTGLFIQRRGINARMVITLAIAGLALAAIGQGWHWLFPINKKLWTSSFVLLSAGLAMFVLSGCVMKFDLWGWRKLAWPYAIVGVNAILVFVGSGILAVTLNRWKIGGMSAHDWLLGKITDGFAVPLAESLGWSWMADPKFSSLCYALVIVAFWWLVCWVLAKLDWQLRV